MNNFAYIDQILVRFWVKHICLHRSNSTLSWTTLPTLIKINPALSQTVLSISIKSSFEPNNFACSDKLRLWAKTIFPNSMSIGNLALHWLNNFAYTNEIATRQQDEHFSLHWQASFNFELSNSASVDRYAQSWSRSTTMSIGLQRHKETGQRSHYIPWHSIQ